MTVSARPRRFFSGFRRFFIMALAVGVTACPAVAGARAIRSDDLGAVPRPTARSIPAPARAVHHQVVDASGAAASDGFRWDDAGIGAAVTITLLGAGVALAVGMRRRTTQGHPVG